MDEDSCSQISPSADLEDDSIIDQFLVEFESIYDAIEEDLDKSAEADSSHSPLADNGDSLSSQKVLIVSPKHRNEQLEENVQNPTKEMEQCSLDSNVENYLEYLSDHEIEKLEIKKTDLLDNFPLVSEHFPDKQDSDQETIVLNVKGWREKENSGVTSPDVMHELNLPSVEGKPISKLITSTELTKGISDEISSGKNQNESKESNFLEKYSPKPFKQELNAKKKCLELPAAYSKSCNLSETGSLSLSSVSDDEHIIKNKRKKKKKRSEKRIDDNVKSDEKKKKQIIKLYKKAKKIGLFEKFSPDSSVLGKSDVKDSRTRLSSSPDHNYYNVVSRYRSQTKAELLSSCRNRKYSSHSRSPEYSEQLLSDSQPIRKSRTVSKSRSRSPRARRLMEIPSYYRGTGRILESSRTNHYKRSLTNDNDKCRSRSPLRKFKKMSVCKSPSRKRKSPLARNRIRSPERKRKHTASRSRSRSPYRRKRALSNWSKSRSSHSISLSRSRSRSWSPGRKKSYSRSPPRHVKSPTDHSITRKRHPLFAPCQNPYKQAWETENSKIVDNKVDVHINLGANSAVNLSTVGAQQGQPNPVEQPLSSASSYSYTPSINVNCGFPPRLPQYYQQTYCPTSQMERCSESQHYSTSSQYKHPPPPPGTYDVTFKSTCGSSISSFPNSPHVHGEHVHPPHNFSSQSSVAETNTHPSNCVISNALHDGVSTHISISSFSTPPPPLPAAIRLPPIQEPKVETKTVGNNIVVIPTVDLSCHNSKRNSSSLEKPKKTYDAAKIFPKSASQNKDNIIVTTISKEDKPNLEKQNYSATEECSISKDMGIGLIDTVSNEPSPKKVDPSQGITSTKAVIPVGIREIKQVVLNLLSKRAPSHIPAGKMQNEKQISSEMQNCLKVPLDFDLAENISEREDKQSSEQIAKGVKRNSCDDNRAGITDSVSLEVNESFTATARSKHPIIPESQLCLKTSCCKSREKIDDSYLKVDNSVNTDRSFLDQIKAEICSTKMSKLKIYTCVSIDIPPSHFEKEASLLGENQILKSISANSVVLSLSYKDKTNLSTNISEPEQCNRENFNLNLHCNNNMNLKAIDDSLLESHISEIADIKLSESFKPDIKNELNQNIESNCSPDSSECEKQLSTSCISLTSSDCEQSDTEVEFIPNTNEPIEINLDSSEDELCDMTRIGAAVCSKSNLDTNDTNTHVQPVKQISSDYCKPEVPVNYSPVGFNSEETHLCLPQIHESEKEIEITSTESVCLLSGTGGNSELKTDKPVISKDLFPNVPNKEFKSIDTSISVLPKNQSLEHLLISDPRLRQVPYVKLQKFTYIHKGMPKFYSPIILNISNGKHSDKNNIVVEEVKKNSTSEFRADRTQEISSKSNTNFINSEQSDCAVMDDNIVKTHESNKKGVELSTSRSCEVATNDDSALNTTICEEMVVTTVENSESLCNKKVRMENINFSSVDMCPNKYASGKICLNKLCRQSCSQFVKHKFDSQSSQQGTQFKNGCSPLINCSENVMSLIRHKKLFFDHWNDYEEMWCVRDRSYKLHYESNTISWPRQTYSPNYFQEDYDLCWDSEPFYWENNYYI